MDQSTSMWSLGSNSILLVCVLDRFVSLYSSPYESPKVPRVVVVGKALRGLLSWMALCLQLTLLWTDVDMVVASSGILALGMYLLYVVRSCSSLHESIERQSVRWAVILCAVASIHDLGEVYRQPAKQATTLLMISLILRIVVGGLAAIPSFFLLWEEEMPVEEHMLLEDKCPMERAGLFDLCTFSWVNPLICIGLERKLQVADIPPLPQRENPVQSRSLFQLQWNAERQNTSPSFFRLLRALYGWEILGFGCWSACNKALGLMGPLILKLFLDWADAPHADGNQGIWLATALSLQAFLQAVSNAQYSLSWQRFDIRLRTGIMTAIFQQTLKLSVTEKRLFTIGKIVNLMSVDLDRLVSIPSSIFDLFLIPLEVAFALWLLHHEVSYAFTVGLIVLGIMLPLQTVLGNRIQIITTKMLRFRDDRVSRCTEFCSSLKVIRLLGWDEYFQKTLKKSRDAEVEQLQARKYLDAFCVFFWAATPVLVQTSVFVTVILMGKNLSAANTFTAVALLNRLLFPMNYFPWILNGLLEARFSAKRIEKDIFHVSGHQKRRFHEKIRKSHAEFILEKCVFAWNTQDFQLNITDLHLSPTITQLSVLIGPVGCGKSTLLQALLGEVPLMSGSFKHTDPTISFMEQQPWICKGTIKFNITMNKEIGDDTWYQRVVSACGLDIDFTRMDCGDKTIVQGEHQLSGGQTLRIGLARALYQKADAYFFDDPISAIDPITARHIVENCFGPNGVVWEGTLNQPIVVIATHAVEMIEMLNQSRPVNTCVLKEGNIIEKGLFSELKKNGNSFLGNNGSLASQATDKPEYGSKLTKESPNSDEYRETGGIQFAVWRSYAYELGIFVLFVLVIAMTVMQITRNGVDGWLAYYTEHNHHGVSPMQFVRVLVALAIVNCIAVAIRAFIFAYGGLRACRRLYKKLLTSLSSVPLSFYNEASLGRILNRMSCDTYSVDESLPFTLNIFCKDLFEVLGAIILVSVGNPFVLCVLVPITGLYYILQKNYRPTSRHLKRLQATCQSPVLESFTETLQSLLTLKGLKLEIFAENSFLQILTTSQRVSFANANSSAWFGIRLEYLGVCITSFVGFYGAYQFKDQHVTYLLSGTNDTLNTGLLGLTLTYALPLVSQLNSVLNSFVNTEKLMIAVERIKEYSNLGTEGKVDTVVPFLPRDWPSHGEIYFQHVSVIYDAIKAVDNFTCHIPPGSKIGICGRTGAGKSSLLQSLFCLIPYQGAIVIDGVELNSVELNALRKRIGCIPQEPILFRGTIRSNLDPEGRFNDVELQKVLKKCQLESILQNEQGLDTAVDGKDSCLSIGQCQLLCLARGILQPSKVMCIDESSASMDLETGQILQTVMGMVFLNCTVLTIAHRISTIKRSDKVIVLDNGKMVEFEDPNVLLNDTNSLFYKLSQQ